MKQNLFDSLKNGDCAVIIDPEGVERSVVVTRVAPEWARFTWKTGPGRYEYESLRIDRTKFPRFVKAVFPPGVKFLVTSESPVPAAVV